MFGPVLVGVGMLVVGVPGVLRVAVFVGVVLGGADAVVVSLAVRVCMGMTVVGVPGVLGVAVFVVGVLRLRSGHRGSRDLGG